MAALQSESLSCVILQKITFWLVYLGTAGIKCAVLSGLRGWPEGGVTARTPPPMPGERVGQEGETFNCVTSHLKSWNIPEVYKGKERTEAQCEEGRRWNNWRKRPGISSTWYETPLWNETRLTCGAADKMGLAGFEVDGQIDGEPEGEFIKLW